MEGEREGGREGGREVKEEGIGGRVESRRDIHSHHTLTGEESTVKRKRAHSTSTRGREREGGKEIK